MDGKTATFILSTIREEEQQTEMLKKQTATVAMIGAADAIDTNGVAAEQAFNREQVQEQEQVGIVVVDDQMDRLTVLYCTTVFLSCMLYTTYTVCIPYNTMYIYQLTILLHLLLQ